MTLARGEVTSRALAFANEWPDPPRGKAEATTFLDPLFALFGRDGRSADAEFEHRVALEKRGEGRSGVFRLDPLLVEMKSASEVLSSGNGGAAPRPLPTSITSMLT